MFVDFKRTFRLINEGKDDKYAFWELAYKFRINY